MEHVNLYFRFQKRLQSNLLQLVDSVSSQFKSTKENPNTVVPQSFAFPSTQNNFNSSKSSSHESLSNQESQESKNRRKRSSFTDMPKI